MQILSFENFKKFVVSTLILAMTLTCFPISNLDAYASSKTKNGISAKDVEKSFKNMQNISKHSIELTDQNLEDIKSVFNNDLLDNNFILQVSTDNLDLTNIKGLEITDKSGVFKAITVPIIGEEYSMFSSLTVVYDSNNNISTYSESLITKSSNNTFEITSYLEGEKISSNDTGINYVGNEKLQEELEIMEEAAKEIEMYGSKTRGIGAVAGCIAAIAGVDGAVAYLIAGTCVASCPAVPPICAACIGGVCAMGSASITGVVACFNLW